MNFGLDLVVGALQGAGGDALAKMRPLHGICGENSFKALK